MGVEASETEEYKEENEEQINRRSEVDEEEHDDGDGDN